MELDQVIVTLVAAILAYVVGTRKIYEQATTQQDNQSNWVQRVLSVSTTPTDEFGVAQVQVLLSCMRPFAKNDKNDSENSEVKISLRKRFLFWLMKNIAWVLIVVIVLVILGLTVLTKSDWLSPIIFSITCIGILLALLAISQYCDSKITQNYDDCFSEFRDRAIRLCLNNTKHLSADPALFQMIANVLLKEHWEQLDFSNSSPLHTFFENWLHLQAPRQIHLYQNFKGIADEAIKKLPS